MNHAPTADANGFLAILAFGINANMSAHPKKQNKVLQQTQTLLPQLKLHLPYFSENDEHIKEIKEKLFPEMERLFSDGLQIGRAHV